MSVEITVTDYDTRQSHNLLLLSKYALKALCLVLICDITLLKAVFAHSG